MARYIKFTGDNGYCGCDFEDLAVFDDNTTDEEIDEYGRELMFDNAETFAYVATGWEADWVSEQDKEDYYEGCYFEWEEISEEEYNKLI